MAPTLYGILMFLAGLFISGQGIVYMAFIATLFGATTVAFATALGGANITPAMLAQGFVGLNILRKESLRGFLAQLRFGSPAFWLLLLTAWAVASAFILPRFFEGQFMVASFDRGAANENELSPLKPTSLNITQAMYAFLAFMAFVMMRVLLKRPGATMVAARAVLWIAGLNAIAALIGLIHHYTGVLPLVSYLKNANYAMMGGEVAGLARVTGTFSETSAYSQYTLAILAFTHTLWMFGVYRNWARFLTITNLGFLLVSTSGTAYVGLVLCMTVAVVYSIWRLFRQGSLGPYSFYLKLSAIGVIAGIGVLLFIPAALTAVTEYFDVVIGSKLTSQSGYTRRLLNEIAYGTFLDTLGMGAGLGCCRASSFALVLLSNLGWVGTVLFCFFVAPLLMGRRPAWANHEHWVVAVAARRAMFAFLVSALLVALVYDLGFLFYLMAALAYLPKTPEEAG